MNKKYKVLLLEEIDKKGIEVLQEKAEIFYAERHDKETISKAMAGKDALIHRDRGFITKEMLAENPSIKVVGRHGVGLDPIDVKGAEELGVYVVNTPFATAKYIVKAQRKWRQKRMTTPKEWGVVIASPQG